MSVKITARKWMGDDRYSWAIFRSDRAEPVVSGLGKSEVPYYKRNVAKLLQEQGVTISNAKAIGLA